MGNFDLGAFFHYLKVFLDELIEAHGDWMPKFN